MNGEEDNARNMHYKKERKKVDLDVHEMPICETPGYFNHEVALNRD